MIYKAGILNTYDWRNRGDLAIIQVQMAWIRSKIPDAEFRVFSPCWKENEMAFGSDVSYPPPITVQKEAGLIHGVLGPVASWLKASRSTYEGDAWERFCECDGYFLCGGGYLYSSRSPLVSRQLWIHAANSLLALRSGKPVMQFPQSWGPLEKGADRWICAKLARNLPMIAARGSESAAIAAELGGAGHVLDLPDVVIAMRELLPDLFDLRENHGREGLGISPIEYGFARKCTASDRDLYLDKLGQIAGAYHKNFGGGIHIYVQVCLPGHDDDAPMANRLQQVLAARGVPAEVHNPEDWNAYWRHISRRAVFLGCRMHSCIFAMVAGVPVIGLAYQPKFRELFTRLGLPERCFDIGNFEVEATLERISEAMHQGPAIVRQRVAEASAALLQGLEQCWRAGGFPYGQADSKPRVAEHTMTAVDLNDE